MVRSSRYAVLLMLALSPGACSTRSPSPAEPARAQVVGAPSTEGLAPSPAHKPQPARDPDVVPALTVEVRGPSQVAAGTEIPIVIILHSRLAAGHTLDLSVRLPEGVRLVDGAERKQVASGAPSIDHAIKIAIDRVPEQDLVVDVTLADAPGQHVAGVYRFGRPEPPHKPHIENFDNTIHKQYIEQQRQN